MKTTHRNPQLIEHYRVPHRRRLTEVAGFARSVLSPSITVAIIGPSSEASRDLYDEVCEARLVRPVDGLFLITHGSKGFGAFADRLLTDDEDMIRLRDWRDKQDRQSLRERAFDCVLAAAQDPEEVATFHTLAERACFSVVNQDRHDANRPILDAFANMPGDPPLVFTKILGNVSCGYLLPGPTSRAA